MEVGDGTLKRVDIASSCSSVDVGVGDANMFVQVGRTNPNKDLDRIPGF